MRTPIGWQSLFLIRAANLLEEYVKEYPASAGGAWIAAVNGFAGIKERDGELVREPSLPDR